MGLPKCVLQSFLDLAQIDHQVGFVIVDLRVVVEPDLVFIVGAQILIGDLLGVGGNAETLYAVHEFLDYFEILL